MGAVERGLEEKVTEAEEHERAKEAEEDAKRQRRAVEENVAREWSDAGSIAVVDTRIDLESAFASTKSKNDKSWADASRVVIGRTAS